MESNQPFNGTSACMRLEIKNRLGLHARAAAQFVQVANRFEADITVTKDGQEVNGKSILALMMLAAGIGSSIDVTATGPQADAAVAAIAELVELRFHEE